jgi:hypothetical protein
MLGCRGLLLGACVLWLVAPCALGRSKKAKKSRGGGGVAATTWKEWVREFDQRLVSDVGSGAAGRDDAFANLGCTIDRHTPRTLSEQQFLRDYYLKRPVIIERVAPDAWTEPFSRESLINNYGFLQVKALQKIGDRLKHKCAQGVKPVQTTLGEYLKKMSLPPELAPTREEGGMPDEPWMVFDHFALNGPSVRALNEMLRSGIPKAIFHKDMDPILSIGGADAGTQFHKHADGFSILIHGHKRWFMTPSDNMPLPTFPVRFIRLRPRSSGAMQLIWIPPGVPQAGHRSLSSCHVCLTGGQYPDPDLRR